MRKYFNSFNIVSYFLLYPLLSMLLFIIILVLQGDNFDIDFEIIGLNIILSLIHIIWFIFKNKKVRYLINTLLFILFYCVQIVPIIAYSWTYIRQGPSGLVAMASIICLFTSYFIVKLIRRPKKQNLTSGTINIADELMKLNELKEKGILTEEEFTEQKKKLL